MSKLKTHRTELDIALTKRTNDLWEYVRTHSHSLDSAVACRIIREALDAATVDACEHSAMMADQLKASAKMKRGLRVRIRELELRLETE